MIKNIINSKTRLQILSFLFFQTEKDFYAREIITDLKLDPANAHKELKILEKGKFIFLKNENNKKLVSLNKKNIYFGALKNLMEIYNQEQDKEKWWVSEEIPSANPVMTTWMIYKYNMKHLKKEIGLHSDFRCMAIFEKGFTKIVFHMGELVRLCDESLDKILTDTDWGLGLIRDVRDRINNWHDVSKKIYNTNLSALSNQELLDLYLKAYEIHRAVYTPAFAINAADFVGGKFSKYLLNLLEKRKDELRLKYSPAEAFSVLTTPDYASYGQKEYLDLLTILEKIENQKEVKEIFIKNDNKLIEAKLRNEYMDFFKLLARHQEKYGWLSYQFEGPGWGIDYFIDILASLIRQNKISNDLKEEFEERKNNNIKTKDKIREIFKLSEQEKNLFKIAEGFVETKGYRKDVMFYAMYCQDFLFQEIAKRSYLSLKQVRYIYPWEFRKVLLDNKINLNELNDRFNFHVFYSDKKGEKILTKEKGEEFIRGLDFIKEKTENIKELLGDTASPGKVRGVAKTINTPKDIEKMNRGDVLVSYATSPDLMPAIKKCVAIVTDMGGIICHASIISRELNIPCVVGTKIGTKVLEDGDLIEVDASHGRVTIIEKKNKKQKQKEIV